MSATMRICRFCDTPTENLQARGCRCCGAAFDDPTRPPQTWGWWAYKHLSLLAVLASLSVCLAFGAGYILCRLLSQPTVAPQWRYVMLMFLAQ